MKLKDMWKDIIDGESEIVGENINNIAHAVIKNEKNKVDKEDGKGLSSNDFTDAEKEKLARLQNYDDTDVYNEIKKFEENSKTIFSNALTGEKSDTSLNITDVSPLEHEIDISLSSDTVTDFSSVNVTARGQNLLNPNVYLEPQTQYGVTLKYIPEEDVFCLDGNCVTTSTDGAHFTTELPELIKIDKNKEYIVTVEFVSGTASYSNENEYMIFFIGAGDYEGHKNNYIKGDLKGGKNYAYQAKYDYLTYVWIYKITNGDSFDNFKFKIQVSEKEFYNDYDKWIPEKTVKANADGTVESIELNYPTTSLITDNENVTINCKYNRDINKAFAELQAMILEG